MFRIRNVMGKPAEVLGYYIAAEKEKSHADYYSQGEAIGLWGGLAAERLGLIGEVAREDFDALSHNRHPRTGERLTPRTRDGRRVGFDLNFHAPKSLTLLWAVTQDPAIVQAMKQAARDTMQLLEQDAATRVRLGGQYKDRRTGELCHATFFHHTSRPTKDHPIPDPHLHLHTFVWNATFDKTENRWKALQPSRFHRSAFYYQSIFHARLSAEVKKLGYPIAREGKVGWEVAGIDKAMRAAFSRRTREIESEAKRLGISDADRKAELGAKTRQKKNTRLTMRDLRRDWLDRMTPEQKQLIASSRQRSSAPGITPEQAMDYAVAHWFERSAIVEDRRIVAEALRHGVGSMELDDINRVMAERKWHSHTDEEERNFLTTPEVLAEEDAMCAFAVKGRGRHKPLGDPDRVIQPHDGITLNAEQQAACRHVWSSQDRVIAIRGAAGSGKTTMIKEAIKGLEAAGCRVVALAPSVAASRGVLREAGMSDAETVAMFLGSKDLQEKARNAVIWIDEASLIGTRGLSSVFKQAERLNARVVLSGDPMQHKAVERGEVLRVLEKHAGVVPIEVTRILRQRGAYRRAVEAFSQGKAVEGLGRMKKMGAIIEIAGEERFDAIARDYVQTTGKGKDVLVVSPTHAEGDAVTRAIRMHLKHTGRLDREDRQRPCYRDLQWTKPQKGDPAGYEAGQRVFFNRAAPGCKAGTWWDVTGKDHTHVYVQGKDGMPRELPLELADRFTVFRSGTLDVARGELLRCTKNTTDAMRRRKLTNGTIYRVNGFNPRNGNLRLKPILTSGRPFEVAADNGLFTYGYCTTSHAAQGRTVDTVLIAQGEESVGATSARQLYVSVSRGREGVRLYTDNPGMLERIAAEKESLQTATDLKALEDERKALAYKMENARLVGCWREMQHRAKRAWHHGVERARELRQEMERRSRTHTWSRVHER